MNYFIIGICIFAVLAISYLVEITLEEGGNYLTRTSLLSVLIFYNPFILGIYCLIGLIFIIKSIKKS